jgi:hypothetical protein
MLHIYHRVLGLPSRTPRGRDTATSRGTAGIVLETWVEGPSVCGTQRPVRGLGFVHRDLRGAVPKKGAT